MTPEHKALVAELRNIGMFGKSKWKSEWADRAAAAIEALSAQCAQPQAGEPVASFDDRWLGDGDSVHVLASPQPANPAQVTDAMVNAVLTWVCDDVLPAYDIPSDVPRNDPELPDSCRAALTAAIGAGGQAVACKECDGTGFKDKNGAHLTLARNPCGACGGSGYAPSVSNPADERVVEAMPSDLVGRIVDDAIIRCRELPDYAGRPAWEAAIDAAIRAALAQEGRKNG